MGNSSKRDARAFELLEDESQAIALRKTGATLEQIARALGYKSKAKAFHLLQSAREKWARQNAASVEVLIMESRATLEHMKFQIAEKVLKGDLAAISTAIRIEERLAALLGLDAPKRSEVSGPGGKPIEMIDASERVVSKLARLLAAQDGDPSKPKS